jgi:hypothetical protein
VKISLTEKEAVDILAFQAQDLEIHEKLDQPSDAS